MCEYSCFYVNKNILIYFSVYDTAICETRISECIVSGKSIILIREGYRVLYPEVYLKLRVAISSVLNQ